MPRGANRQSAFLHALTAPLSAWSRRTRILALITCVVLAAALAITLAFHQQSFFAIADAAYYLRIAQGDQAHVMKPFASRQLAALIAGSAARLLHLSIEHSFLLQGFFALFLTLSVSFWLLLRTAAPRWMLAAIALLPIWTDLFHYLALPDVFYAALLAIFLLLLDRNRLLAASLMLFPLMLTRESTWLLLLCLLAAAWNRLRPRDIAAAIASAAAATLIVAHLARHSLDNEEHLPQALYMAAKIPWNLIHNLFGLTPWSNVNRDFCDVAPHQLPLHLGPIHAIGVCDFSTIAPFVTLDGVLTLFGLLPLLLVVLWSRHRQATRSTLLRFTLLYGTISFLLAPLLGTDFRHLAGYAWPLFVIAVPALLTEFHPNPRHALAGVAFCALHLLILYLPFPGTHALDIAVKAALWLAGYALLLRWQGPSPRRPRPASP